MAQRYAKDQPSGFTNSIERVAVVGAGGQFGTFIINELLKTGKHTITALTRQGSKSKLPDGVKAAPVSYDDEKTIVDALKGQQFLVITMAVTAPPDTHSKIVQAAAKAGVPYIMPNSYGMDTTNENLAKELPLTGENAKQDAEIQATGASSTPMICNLWYEYSLVMGEVWFGFSFQNKELTYYDDGNTKVNVTTWEQCARAIAALVSLKELPDDEADKSPTVSSWRNKGLYVSSFLVSQRDMFESWLRVTGDKEENWTIKHESSQDRYDRGIAAMKTAGDPLSARMGAALASFVRVFFPNGDGNYEDKPRGLDNDVLGLPKEDLDERTMVAKKMLDDQYPTWVMGRLSNPS